MARNRVIGKQADTVHRKSGVGSSLGSFFSLPRGLCNNNTPINGMLGTFTTAVSSGNIDGLLVYSQDNILTNFPISFACKNG